MKEKREKTMSKVKKILKEENVINIILLLIISIIICIPLLNEKFNITYDDGVQHIARLMGTFQSLQEGQSFPVIMSEFCNRIWILLEFVLQPNNSLFTINI